MLKKEKELMSRRELHNFMMVISRYFCSCAYSFFIVFLPINLVLVYVGEDVVVVVATP